MKAALNQDWNKEDKGWVKISKMNGASEKLEVIETGSNTGLFTTKFKVPVQKVGDEIVVSYGYFGFGTEAVMKIK